MQKIKKIIIVALLSASIMVNGIYICYADTLSATVDLGGGLAAMSAGGTAAALVSVEAALPFILCALGIAGFAYVAGKANLITTIYNQVKEGTEDFCYEVKDAQGITQRYFKSLYCKGKNYIEETYLKAIASVAINEGLFDGVTETGVTIPEFTIANDWSSWMPYTITRTLSLSNLMTYFLGMINDPLKSKVYTGYTGLLARYPEILNNYNSYMISCQPGNALYIYCWNIDLPYNGVFKKTGAFATDPVSGEFLIGSQEQFSYAYGVYWLYNNTYRSLSTSSREIFAGFLSYVDSNDSMHYALSGVNAIPGETTGIPVTDNIPIEEDGDITLPTWDNPALEGDETIDDALPVSIPDGYTYPCVWDPYNFPDPDFPDVITPDIEWTWPYPIPDNPDPAIPDDTAQPVAQEGDTTDDPVIDYPYYPQNETFLLPETIKTKFPFCVPFDMVKCVNSLSATRAAPHYEWNYNIAGMTGTAVIDLSRFDAAADVLRRCELVAFVIGLIAGTKSLLGDRSG